MDINEISRNVIGAAIDVHRELGPGLLESAYESCLCHELTLRGIKYARQNAISVKYKGVSLECGYRMDLLVEDKIVVELKSIDKFLPIHEAQLISYLKLSNCAVGLLINFNVLILKHGIKRKVFNHDD